MEPALTAASDLRIGDVIRRTQAGHVTEHRVVRITWGTIPVIDDDCDDVEMMTILCDTGLQFETTTATKWWRMSADDVASNISDDELHRFIKGAS